MNLWITRILGVLLFKTKTTGKLIKASLLSSIMTYILAGTHKAATHVRGREHCFHVAHIFCLVPKSHTELCPVPWLLAGLSLFQRNKLWLQPILWLMWHFSSWRRSGSIHMPIYCFFSLVFIEDVEYVLCIIINIYTMSY